MPDLKVALTLTPSQGILALARLGLWCLEESRGDSIGDIDGGEFQEKALELGVLTAQEVTEPCGSSFCACAEVGFPSTCYRYAPWIKEAEASMEARHA